MMSPPITSRMTGKPRSPKRPVSPEKLKKIAVRRAHTKVPVTGLALSLCLHAGLFIVASGASLFVANDIMEATVSTEKQSSDDDQKMVFSNEKPFPAPLPPPEAMQEPVKPPDVPTHFEMPVPSPPKQVVVNGFKDSDDGGTSTPEIAQKSGGGGGDENMSALEKGHMATDADWSKLKYHATLTSASTDTIGIGGSAGSGSSGGALATAGGGHGAGNGDGSGAAFSQGSGSGSGTGRNGSGHGTGIGKAAPAGETRSAEAINVNGGNYPASARKARHEGVVTLKIEVLADGNVGQIEMEESSGYSDLDNGALRAARGWTFRPALEDGKPVVSWRSVPVRYVLR